MHLAPWAIHHVCPSYEVLVSGQRTLLGDPWMMFFRCVTGRHTSFGELLKILPMTSFDDGKTPPTMTFSSGVKHRCRDGAASCRCFRQKDHIVHCKKVARATGGDWLDEPLVRIVLTTPLKSYDSLRSSIYFIAYMRPLIAPTNGAIHHTISRISSGHWIFGSVQNCLAQFSGYDILKLAIAVHSSY